MTDGNDESMADRPLMTREESDTAARGAVPPPPPVPASDPRLAIVDDQGTKAADENDLFKLPASEALRLLSASVEMLVHMTGDFPPTPPTKTPTNPQMSGMLVEKDNIVRSHSQNSLYQLRQQAEQAEQASPAAPSSPLQPHAKQPSENGTAAPPDSGLNNLQAYSASMSAQLMVAQQKQQNQQAANVPTSVSTADPEPIDGVKLRNPSVSKPEPLPYIIVGADSQPVNLQHGAITRKFYSKREPPISINQYLVRLHQFCPMSTAVYLATSLYIHRLAVVERAIPVTRRNAHRLVLAGLRVAMKALEDLSYPHSKIAKVGGVSEVELARLEISFCFLAGFELVVGEELLTKHWKELRGGKAQQILRGLEVPTLRLDRRPREVPPAASG